MDNISMRLVRLARTLCYNAALSKLLLAEQTKVCDIRKNAANGALCFGKFAAWATCSVSRRTTCRKLVFVFFVRFIPCVTYSKAVSESVSAP